MAGWIIPLISAVTSMASNKQNQNNSAMQGLGGGVDLSDDMTTPSAKTGTQSNAGGWASIISGLLGSKK